MKIADLDMETKKVVLWAHIVVRDPTARNVGKLKEAVEEWDSAHAKERAKNLGAFLKDLFDGA